jgi:hypothetical protein
MWFKEYRDYPIDRPLIKEPVESGRGIIGCEMHEINGWGTDDRDFPLRKKGLIARLISFLVRRK